MLSQNQTNIIVPRFAWVILALAYLCSVNASIIMNKVAPLVPDLMATFNVSLSVSGYLMSVLGLTGLALSLPGGLIIQRLGVRKAGMIAFVCFVSGSALGALSGSYGLLLAGRVLEGFGNSLIWILSGAIIAMWFPPEKSGLPMGIWSTATPVGGFLTLNIIPALAERVGWEGIWWVTTGVSLVVMALFWLLIRPAPGINEETPEAGRVEVPHKILSDLYLTFTNKSVWLVTLTWFCFGMALTPLMTFYPTFLATEGGYSMARAGFLVGLFSIASIPSAPLAGWVSDVVDSRRWVLITGLLIFVPLIWFVFQVSGALIPVVMVLAGASFGLIATTVYAIAPIAMGNPRLAGMGIAMLAMGMNLAMLAAPPIFGRFVENLGWANAAYLFTPLAVLAIFLTLVNKKVA